MSLVSATRRTQQLFSVSLALCLLSPAVFAEPVQVALSTNKGDIVLELDKDRAPQTVSNFLQYVEDGFYDETLFHRVIEGFMIQGGGFSTDYQRKSTRAPISNEAYNGLRNNQYTIAMARTTAPHSATAQFFINSENNRNLDHTDTTQRGWGYTVFGKVVEGEAVVDAISQTRTSSGGPFSRDVPTEPVVILKAYQMGVESAGSTAADAGTTASPANASVNALQSDEDTTADQGEKASDQPVEQN